MEYDYYFGIASYHRKDRQPMLHYLHEMGYESDRIIMAVQTREDYEEYKSRYDRDCILLFKEGVNVATNKNTILDFMQTYYPNKPIIMCSDKVRGVQKLSTKMTVDLTKEEFRKLCEKGISISRKLDCKCFGVYPVENTMFMEESISTNRNILGCFMGILDTSIKFHERFALKEDMQYVCECIKRGYRTLRFNNICLKATLHTQGGCHSAWNSDGDSVNNECTNLLLSLYPNITSRHSTRRNEIRLTAKSRKIKTSII